MPHNSDFTEPKLCMQSRSHKYLINYQARKIFVEYRLVFMPLPDRDDCTLIYDFLCGKHDMHQFIVSSTVRSLTENMQENWPQEAPSVLRGVQLINMESSMRHQPYHHRGGYGTTPPIAIQQDVTSLHWRRVWAQVNSYPFRLKLRTSNSILEILRNHTM